MEVEELLDAMSLVLNGGGPAQLQTINRELATIENALDTIGPGLDALTEQRALLVPMLEALARLGEVGTRVIEQSAENTVRDLELLQPILTQLAEAGPGWPTRCRCWSPIRSPTAR